MWRVWQRIDKCVYEVRKGEQAFTKQPWDRSVDGRVKEARAETAIEWKTRAGYSLVKARGEVRTATLSVFGDSRLHVYHELIASLQSINARLVSYRSQLSNTNCKVSVLTGALVVTTRVVVIR